MTEATWTFLTEAHETLRSTVAAIGPQDWAEPTPCSDWNVTQVVQHAVGDQHAWAWAVTGVATSTENPFAPSGQLDGDVSAYVEAGLHAAEQAWSTVPADRQDAPTPLPPVPSLPAPQAVAAIALDAMVHSWDIAVALGRPSPVTAAQAGKLLEVAKNIVEPLRGFAYQAPLEPVPGEDELAVLLRYLGRDPHWHS
jgi:uncharacterized protein (TIGR03086 family)